MASRTLRIAAVPLMLACGTLIALQSQLNGHLAHRLGTGPRAGLTAAEISFSSVVASRVGFVMAASFTTTSVRDSTARG